MFRDEPPPPRHPWWAPTTPNARPKDQIKITDDGESDGFETALNGSVLTNAINTHHFEMFSDEICLEKLNCVARVSGADVATERKVRGTALRTVGLRYTALNPPPQNTSGRHDTLHHSCTELQTTGIMTPLPLTLTLSVIRSLLAASEHCCVNVWRTRLPTSSPAK